MLAKLSLLFFLQLSDYSAWRSCICGDIIHSERSNGLRYGYLIVSTINIYPCIVLSVLENIMWRQFCVVLLLENKPHFPSLLESSFTSPDLTFHSAACCSLTRSSSHYIYTPLHQIRHDHVTKVLMIYDTWRTWSRDHSVTWSTAREGSGAHLIQLFHIRNKWSHDHVSRDRVTWPARDWANCQLLKTGL